MLTVNAATASAAHLIADHGWSGFSESTPLRSNSSVRLSIQFSRGDTPTANVAVWAFFLPDRATAHPVLMVCDK